MTEQCALVTVEANHLQTTTEISLGFNLDNLPSDLKKQITKLQNEQNHYLALLKGVELKIEAWVERVKAWYAQTTPYGPRDILDSEELSNYYPAVVLDDGPLLGENPMKTAKERNQFEQRRLATDLLTGELSKPRKESLRDRAARLLCSLNPRDDEFFSEETLEECLEMENLKSSTRVNKVLGRPRSTYIKKPDKRDALWRVWNERNEEILLNTRFEQGEFGDLEGAVLDTFTALAWATMTGEVFQREWNPHGSTTEELRRALFDVLGDVESQNGDRDDYLLDPREEDTWIGLTNFTAELKKQPQEEWYYLFQDGKTPAQRWMKEFGLEHLYGAHAEWWKDVPDKANKDIEKLKEQETPASLNFYESYTTSEVKETVFLKYYVRLQEVLCSE